MEDVLRLVAVDADFGFLGLDGESAFGRSINGLLRRPGSRSSGLGANGFVAATAGEKNSHHDGDITGLFEKTHNGLLENRFLSSVKPYNTLLITVACEDAVGSMDLARAC